MLAARTQELLTAFVDGALTRRERKAALRLLNESSEARTFLRELHENAHRLKQLPAKKLSPDFAQSVLATIRERGLQPTPTQVKPTARRTPRWAGIAVAACVLLAVGGGFFAYRSQDSIGPIAQGPIEVDTPKPMLNTGAKLALAEVAQKVPQLALEVQAQPAVHLSMVAKNDGQTFDRLSEAFQDQGIQLVIDPEARVRISKGQPVFVYVENLKPEELQKVLQSLDKSGRQATFGAMQIESFSSQDAEQLGKTLGVSREQLESPQLPARRPTKPETRPLTAERLAVAVSNQAVQSPQSKRFVQGRSAVEPGSLRVLFVINPE